MSAGLSSIAMGQTRLVRNSFKFDPRRNMQELIVFGQRRFETQVSFGLSESERQIEFLPRALPVCPRRTY